MSTHKLRSKTLTTQYTNPNFNSFIAIRFTLYVSLKLKQMLMAQEMRIK